MSIDPAIAAEIALEPNVWGPEELFPGVIVWAARNHSGAWCAYASVPYEPLAAMYAREWDESRDLDDIEVHGGVTWCGEPCSWERLGTDLDAPAFCLGFDCTHAWDFVPAYADLRPSDSLTYRNLAYVREQVALLAKQIALAMPEEVAQ